MSRNRATTSAFGSRVVVGVEGGCEEVVVGEAAWDALEEQPTTAPEITTKASRLARTRRWAGRHERLVGMPGSW